MKYELTFSRRTLFINVPFSLVGKDAGQPICVELEEGVKLQEENLPAEAISSLHKAMFTSSLLHNKAELQCHVIRFANSSLTKDGTRGRNRAYPVKEYCQHPFLITTSFPRKKCSFRKISNIMRKGNTPIQSS
jgi:hypothetical protein